MAENPLSQHVVFIGSNITSETILNDFWQFVAKECEISLSGILLQAKSFNLTHSFCALSSISDGRRLLKCDITRINSSLPYEITASISLVIVG